MKRREFLASSLSGAPAIALPSGLTYPARAGYARRMLRVTRRTIEVNGKAASVFRLEQPDGAKGLGFHASKRFNVLLENATSEDTIVRWHGLTPPWSSDGVAGSPLPLLKARENRVYDFPKGTPGTHWMNTPTQNEQAPLAAPLFIEVPADTRREEQEVLILLHDFSFKSLKELLAGLTKPTRGDAGHGAMAMAMPGKHHGAMELPGMDMPGVPSMDLTAVDYEAYLANDRTLDDPEVVQVKRGGRVHLRIISGATATAFTIDLGEIEGELVAIDGSAIEEALRITVRIPPSRSVTIAVDVDNPGQCALYRYHLDRMATGSTATFSYRN